MVLAVSEGEEGAERFHRGGKEWSKLVWNSKLCAEEERSCLKVKGHQKPVKNKLPNVLRFQRYPKTWQKKKKISEVTIIPSAV